MKIFIFILISTMLITSCTHSIVRTGYQKDRSVSSGCDVIITKFMQVTDSIQKIGEIELGETGFSVVCSEVKAIQILKNEACSLNADIINIVDEKRPDFISSCYRCRAEFYKITKASFHIQSSELYNKDVIKKRASQDRTKTTVYVITALTIGAIVSFLYYQ